VNTVSTIAVRRKPNTVLVTRPANTAGARQPYRAPQHSIKITAAVNHFPANA
jgi:hypothetical protein